jgi:hypothetical protein
VKNRKAWLGCAVALVATAASASACVTKDDKTQITIAFSSETEIPKELTEFRLTVTKASGSVVHDWVYDVHPESGFRFPQTLALVPSDSDALKAPVTVELEGTLTRGGTKTTIVFRRAIVSYFEGRTILVPMALRMACFQYGRGDCGANESCVGGVCKPAAVTSDKVVDYDPSYVFPTPATCFDDAKCIGGSTPVTVDFSDCSFTLPSGDTSHVNASVEWIAAKERVIVLNADDPDEGWTARDATHGVLSPGVCKALQLQGTAKNGAERLFLSTACAAKKALQPNCAAEYGVDLEGGVPSTDGGTD